MKVHDHFFSLGAVALALGGVALRFALAQARSNGHTALHMTGDGVLFDLEGDDMCAKGDGACTVSLLQRSAAAVTHIKVPMTAAASPDRKIDLGLVGWPMHRPSGLEDGLPLAFVSKALMATWACVAIYMACVVWDINKLYRLSFKPRDKLPAPSKDDEELWSAGGIWMLCFYRLYTGFLAATWLPYVLAMEGETLWASNQALFMGIAKLIYGLTVLMNPMFGLVGDMLAEICQGAARRLWILLGIVLSALGIMLCLYAGPRHEFYLYMFGITLWRLGESLNDVTTEAIVPELVPTQQFALASSIKAASFLVGGLLGYCLLFFMADVHYTWCYFAYLGCMFVFAIPSLYLLINDKPAPPNPFRQSLSFSTNLSRSYTTPATLEGGFPQISFAIFIMSCGTAPMFFFLLIIRDLIGVHEEVTLQQDFAIGSVLFFLAAALATMLDVTYGDRIGPSSRAQHLDAQAIQELSPRSRAENMAAAKSWENEKVRRLTVLVIISVVYALSVCSLPIVQLLPTVAARLTFFYPLVVFFGGTFGLGYSRFQDATWRLLPRNCDMANAMGFNVMARNLGLGVGNFCFGALLEFFKVPQVTVATTATTLTTTTHGFTVNAMQSSTAHQVYEKTGYDAMCFGCMLFNFAAGILAYRITAILPKPEDEES